MLIVLLGLVILACAVPLVGWAYHRRLRSVSGWAAGAVGLVLLLVGSTAIGLYAWALTATDDSQLARALVWGDSQYGDQDRFPSRVVRASADPVMFRPISGSPMAEFVPGSGEDSLEQFLASSDTTAFIVIRGDDLLYEGYFNGSSREAMQTSFSVAKSFVATLVGIALGEGYLAGLDDPLTAYVPELAERDRRFEDITLQHLITMSSGLSFSEGWSPWADPANTYHGTDLRAAAVKKPNVESEPGTVFHYNDWNVILLGLVLERATSMPVAEFMETRLWQPMGAEADGSWSLDSESGGFEKMFVGVNGRAIDMAKLGWLYLHGGRNGDRQVVPAEFVMEATSVDTETDPAAGYQYLWWIDEARQSYFANGDHGQFIYVDPSAELVIVRNGRGLGGVDWVEFFGDLGDWLEPRIQSN